MLVQHVEPEQVDGGAVRSGPGLAAIGRAQDIPRISGQRPSVLWRQHVDGGQAHRLGVEEAGRDEVVGVGEDDRVAGRQRASDRDTLLFAAGQGAAQRMRALPDLRP